MCWRWWQFLAVALLGVLALGCRPSDQVLLSDAENPYVALGLEHGRQLAHDKAISAFEKALEVNPHSVRAHYELGILFDRHKKDYVTALYHYNRVLVLQPDDWPSDNVRSLVQGCRQEFVKAEVMAPIASDLQRQIEKLQEENLNLQREITALKSGPSPPVQPTGPPPAVSPSRSVPGSETPGASPPTAIAARSALAQNNLTASPHGAGASPANARIHRVRPGETMAAISRRYNISLTALLDANRHVNPRTMKPGTAVRVPGP